MNNLEKKSFYSFLSLYLVSSFVFIGLGGFWYYLAQKNSLESNIYYKLQHLADNVSKLVIHAHMNQSQLVLPICEDGYEYQLIASTQTVEYPLNYFDQDGYKVLVSSAPQGHLDIQYVVAKTKMFHKDLQNLQRNVLLYMMGVFFCIVVVSWFLSKIFMRPIREKVFQIEQFIQDISHELNTPITSLSMSSKRALQKQNYDEKILRNISISTKQLYNIYKSLTFLSFDVKEGAKKRLDLKSILQECLKNYDELLHAKELVLTTQMKESYLLADKNKIELLFSNLISNAIKYSLPQNKIQMKLEPGYFEIQDEGVGIAKNKIEDIFKLYERGSHIAGGFGIGLSIVKKICDEYKIDIHVESELKKGSLFELTWREEA